MVKAVFVLALVALSTFAVIDAAKVDVDDEGVLAAAHEAARRISLQLAEKHHNVLLKVKKASIQGSTGYQLDIILGLTKCLKSEVEFDQAGACELQDNRSTYKKCTVFVTKDGEKFTLKAAGCLLASKNEV